MNTKSKDFGIVLEKYDDLNKFELTCDMLENYLKSCDFIEYYAFILHYRDYNDIGVLERPHYHVVITCVNPYAKNTILNDIARDLVKNRNAISIRALVDKSKMIAYLVHKNEKLGNKYRYSCQDIITNDYDYTIDQILHPCNEVRLTVEDIIKIVECSENLTKVYLKVGIKNSRLYRNVIKDIWDYYSGKKEKKLKGLKK